jgi:hypothetical protein
MNIVASFIGYILAFNHYGFSLTDLFQSANDDHFNQSKNEPWFFKGHLYSNDEQVKILGAAQSS